MSDYQIDCATKEEWAQRAFSAEARIAELEAIDAEALVRAALNEAADQVALWITQEPIEEAIRALASDPATISQIINSVKEQGNE